MTVRELLECCTSHVGITLDEDSRTGELEILVENTVNAEDVLSNWILDHEIHLMHCENDKLIISLFTIADIKESEQCKINGLRCEYCRKRDECTEEMAVNYRKESDNNVKS